MSLQRTLRLIYPSQCLLCRSLVQSDAALCGACWGDTPFIIGLVCDCCGVPLPGEARADTTVLCDTCLEMERGWNRGRAAFVYRDNARKLVLGLKHEDRSDLVQPLARWLAGALAPVLEADMLVTCIPLHWRRLLRRRYNQAALLSHAVAKIETLAHCPDLLLRPRATPKLDGVGRAARAEVMAGAITVNAKRAGLLQARHVLIIDDVMTSGATLDVAARACMVAGAADVSVGVLARVALED